jgi:SAM-dependent methyltransferase
VTAYHAGKGLEVTGERLVPEVQHGELVHAEHLTRYALAAQLAPGKRVLDAASGEGYGTALLAAAGARSAIGVDIHEQTVAHARARHSAEFEVADMGSLPFPDDSFDLVVSFETIEHVADPERALNEMRRVLVADGLLLISTPNKREYLVENEFHEREFTHEEFLALLAQHFARVEALLQHNWTLSAVLRAELAADATGERWHRLAMAKIIGLEAGRELYTIALCSEGQLPSLNPVGVAASVDEAQELARRLVEVERTAAKWHGEYQQAEAVAANWHDEYKQAEVQATKWHGEYEKAAALAEQIHETNLRVYQSLSWRITKPLRSAASLGRRLRG